MADSSRHSIYGIVESVYGTTPATPTLKTIRHTGTNLGLSKSTIVSEELRADRQISDARHGVKQVGGDITTELSYASFDDYLEAVLAGTWAVKATKTATTISAAASDSSFNDSGNGFVTAGFEVGDEIIVSGFVTSANDGHFTIATVAAGKITVTKNDGTAVTLVNEAATPSVTIASAMSLLKAGVVRRSFSLLRYFSDIDTGNNPYYLYKGIEFNKLALTVAVNAIVKAVFSVMGQDQADPAGTAPAGSSITAANSNAVMDSFTGAIKEGGSAIGIVTELQMTLDNGEAVKNVIGSDKTLQPSIGRSNLTGQITAYFEDSVMVQKFISETVSSLDFKLADKAGNAYRIVLPHIKYNGGQPDTQGQGAITLAMPIQALLDSVSGSNILIYRIPAKT